MNLSEKVRKYFRLMKSDEEPEKAKNWKLFSTPGPGVLNSYKN